MDSDTASRIGRIGANSLHAKYDSKQLTTNGRAAFLSRFEREVDPLLELTPAERARRAKHARRAYFQKMAWDREKARRGKKAAAEKAVA